jgi:hypothetical protein
MNKQQFALRANSMTIPSNAAHQGMGAPVNGNSNGIDFSQCVGLHFVTRTFP